MYFKSFDSDVHQLSPSGGGNILDQVVGVGARISCATASLYVIGLRAPKRPPPYSNSLCGSMYSKELPVESMAHLISR